jgi:hypothetical protein
MWLCGVDSFIAENWHNCVNFEKIYSSQALYNGPTNFFSQYWVDGYQKTQNLT